MNFLKKKLKPLTISGSSNNRNEKRADKDLEDDLYDEYVIEAPPHPSELLALGVDPTEIDVNDPEKLKELYRKAKEEGKEKKTNSVLLARQRQKEEIEEKKKTREEWKFFDSITARVEQAVKESQRTLEQLKESSAINELNKPDYDLRLTPDEVFRSSATVKIEKKADEWINFSEDTQDSSKKEELKQEDEPIETDTNPQENNFIVEELLEDIGLDLRPADKRTPITRSTPSPEPIAKEPQKKVEEPEFDLSTAARPRPRPNSTQDKDSEAPKESKEIDPFDTSFAGDELLVLDSDGPKESGEEREETVAKALDPFDTSYIKF